jgi:hypothetical protein
MDRVGLLGNKGCGKDTLSDYLVKDKEFVKYSFANPVKEIAKIMFNLSAEQLNGNLKEVIDERWGVSPRVMFQRIGTEFGQYKIYELFPELKDKIYSRGLWLKLFEDFLEENKDKNIVIADVRFKNEVNILKKHNFNIIKINRNRDLNDSHISENEIKLIKNVDYEINNNSTKEALFTYYNDFIYIPF